MGSEADELHIAFLPFTALGHLIPMVDMARGLAARGVKVTIITTPLNALLFQNSIDRDITSGHPIQLLTLPLPPMDSPLPDGCENISTTSAPFPETFNKLFQALSLLQQPLAQLFQHLRFRPHCIVSDPLLPWTTDFANQLGIPRIIFHATNFFYHCVSESLVRYQDKIPPDGGAFRVPGLPNHISFSRSQLPDPIKVQAEFGEIFNSVREAELRSHGAVMNSFYELEPAYINHYRNTLGRKAWHIGPVSLFNTEKLDREASNSKASIDQLKCLSWLESKEPNSVLYVCFGSITRFTATQLLEIASALEALSHPFIWVVPRVAKPRGEMDGEFWLPEGLEERVTKGPQKGFIIQGWVPQVLILEHQAVGGFMTHCGWNSVLESVSSGVPMITWPLFAEQFYNEKLVIEVLKVGVSVGVEAWNSYMTDKAIVVGREDIKQAVSRVMGGGDEARRMRRCAQELGEMAKRAVQEGGSSYADMTALIEELMTFCKK
nr:TPA_asm: hypothetical protein HUJ06_008014 [Nelumbo nucifera]